MAQTDLPFFADWRDHERLPETLADLHSLAFAMLMLRQYVTLITHSS
jgi:hypothetical protein